MAFRLDAYAVYLFLSARGGVRVHVFLRSPACPLARVRTYGAFAAARR